MDWALLYYLLHSKYIKSNWFSFYEIIYLNTVQNNILCCKFPFCTKVRLKNDWNSKVNDFLVLVRAVRRSCYSAVDDSTLLRHANEIKAKVNFSYRMYTIVLVFSCFEDYTIIYIPIISLGNPAVRKQIYALCLKEGRIKVSIR